MKAALLKKYFNFLDMLRESGEVNMWGASKNLDNRYACGRDEAREAHKLWVNTFDKDASLEERIKNAMKLI